MRKAVLSLFAGAALVFGASTAQAQVPLVPKMYSFGIHAGLAQPMGDFGDVVESGWSAGAMLQIKPPLMPLGFRIDGTYNRFGYKAAALSEESADILSGNASVVFDVIPSPLVTPYVLGGVGMHRFSNTANDGSNTDFGFHGGVGLNVGLAGFGTYIEARYVSVQTENSATNYVPITVGIKF